MCIRTNPRLLENCATVTEIKCLDNFRLDYKTQRVPNGENWFVFYLYGVY